MPTFQSAKRALAARDPSLKALFARHRGLKFEPALKRSPFESLVRAIAHQQLNGKAAETIIARMLALFPGIAFPTPEALSTTPPETLRACGYSNSKVRSILDIAAHAMRGVIPGAQEIQSLANSEIIERLLPIFGVGQWTVEMMLIFQLGRLDIWPVDDFGVRKGYQVWNKKREMPSARDLKAVEDKYAPFATVVALHLWREADLAKQSPKTAQRKPTPKKPAREKSKRK